MFLNKTKKDQVLSEFFGKYKIDGPRGWWGDVYDHIVESCLTPQHLRDGTALDTEYAAIIEYLYAIYKIGELVELQCTRIGCPKGGHAGLAQTNLLSRIIKSNYYLGDTNRDINKTLARAITDIDHLHLKKRTKIIKNYNIDTKQLKGCDDTAQFFDWND